LGAEHDSLWCGRAVGVAFDEGGQITRHVVGVVFRVGVVMFLVCL
jgi:hypothetical protein